ncbi:MAG: hypothetical protein KDD73_04145, partial [Anaerolineales bacterium]|nr:hypothetical protein [Anaerolineales bacterium]
RTYRFRVLRSAFSVLRSELALSESEGFCVHRRLHKKQQPLQPPAPKTNLSLPCSAFTDG